MSGYSNFGLRELLGAVAAVASIFLVFILILLYQKYKSRKRLMAKIRREWGREPEREYDPTEYDCISHYYLNRDTDEFQIDDITWNDLDMDRIFMQMNHTRSFIGESSLYYRLRTPRLAQGDLEEFERAVSWFGTHEKEREELEYFFAKIGKTGRQSVFDYIFSLTEAPVDNPLIHIGAVALIFAAVAVLLFNPQPGILLLLSAVGVSMWIYNRSKMRVAPYILACTAIEKVLQSAEQIAKLDVVTMKREELKKAVGAFGKLRRSMFFLVSGDANSDNFLELLLAYLNNLLHIDLLQFGVVVREAAKHIGEFEFIVEEIGRIESAIAVASWRVLHERHAVPVLHEDGELCFSAQGMYHPLIREPVANSVETDRCLLLTGSNASGKSTFLKTAALQAILAQTIHTVTADSYEARYFRVFSSMALRDDLVGEESYYMVEIRSLKRILDRRAGAVPVLCCIDEVLRGTNTVERIAASSQILKCMAEDGVMCIAATHDIELTYLLEGIYRNCHFEEEITDDNICFDYKLREGRAMTRNAIRLLALMGFEERIIQDAERMAERVSKM